MSVEPNNPQKRWAHIFKSYRGTKAEPILPSVGLVALSLVGLDDELIRFNLAYVQPLWNAAVREGGDPLFDARGKAGGGVGGATLDEMNERMLEMLPDHHPYDFALPWAARELGRYFKVVRRSGRTHATITRLAWAEEELVRSLTAIAMWAELERIDLNRTSLEDALEAIGDYEFPEEPVPQANVVFEFDDGWTVQRLGYDNPDAAEDELDAEGAAMQHCVGAYSDRTLAGETFIFSLRDPNGQPHVTMEWAPERRLRAFERAFEPDEGPGATPARWYLEGSIAQIFGKQNEPPIPKYADYMRTFLAERFDNDPGGLLMLAGDESVSFEGHIISGFNFGEFDLSRADFGGATLVDCWFGEVLGVSFNNAKLVRCSFIYGATNSTFIAASITNCTFDNGIDHCDFTSASFTSDTDVHKTPLSFRNLHIIESNFLGAEFQRAEFHIVEFIQGSLAQARFVDCVFDQVRLTHTIVNHVTVSGASTKGDFLQLHWIDLRLVDRDTIRRLLEMATPAGRAHRDVGSELLEVTLPTGTTLPQDVVNRDDRS